MTLFKDKSMLGKLRGKFVALNMATVAVVLVVVLGGILFFNHQQTQAQVDGALDEALKPYITYALEQSGDISKSDAVNMAKNDRSKVASSIGNRGDKDLTPIAVYQVSSDGSYSYLSDASSARLSDYILEDALTDTIHSSDFNQSASIVQKSEALADLGLYCHVAFIGDTAYVAYADMSSIQGWQQLAVILVLAGLGALVVFFIISLYFSRWALKPVEESWTAQKNFVADASHELKTPLTVILANTSLVQKHADSSVASQSQWLESTEHEAKRMQGLVDDMLTLARLDEGLPKSHQFSQIDLSTIVEGTLLQFESLAWENSITITDQVEEDIVLQGDEGKIDRLVNTLLENACKYAGKGGQVNVLLKREGNQALFSVSNSGAQIPAEDLPHVFDRFYRADKARTHSDAAGHGLGLSIAAKIVEAHHGSIGAASDNKLTVFTVKLPLGK